MDAVIRAVTLWAKFLRILAEYWSVDLDNYPDPFSNDPSSVPHAIVISNTSEAPASVTVEGPGGVTLVDPDFVVADGDVHVFRLSAIRHRWHRHL